MTVTTDRLLSVVPYRLCKISIDDQLNKHGYDSWQDANHTLGPIVEQYGLDCNILDDNDKRDFLYSMLASCFDIGEIIEFDKAFDYVLMDTINKPDDEIYEPFKIFYINKWFKADDCYIKGVSVSRISNGIILIWSDFNISTQLSRTGMCFLSDAIKHEKQYYRDIGNYVVNAINIINNPDKDIKEIERFPSHKKLDPTHRKYDPYARKTTYITVGGELKKYIGEYNKRREAVGHNPSFIVRGHWRHFRSSRFKNKQGQSKWIYPYIKGMPEELVHRFVKVVPGDSEK